MSLEDLLIDVLKYFQKENEDFTCYFGYMLKNDGKKPCKSIDGVIYDSGLNYLLLKIQASTEPTFQNTVTYDKSYVNDFIPFLDMISKLSKIEDYYEFTIKPSSAKEIEETLL